MSAWVRNLLLLLVFQLIVLAILQFSKGGEATAPEPLLTADLSQLNSLQIADGDDNTLTLAKNPAGTWLLESGLPADGEKVNGLLEKLSGFELGWPVATRAEAHERFEVANNKFQRKLTLGSGSAEQTLLFGTSPGYQQVHARADSDSVYAVKLSNHEIPAAADDWLDKSLLQAAGDPAAVDWTNGAALTKGEQGWLLNGELANIEAAEAAVSRLSGLSVLGVLASAPGAPPADAKSILVTDSEGDYRLSYWPREANNDHVIMSTRYPDEAFRIANYIGDALQVDADTLLAPKVPDVDLSVPQELEAEAETTSSDEE